MEYYLLLTLETTVIAALALLLWLRTGHVGFPVGIVYSILVAPWSLVDHHGSAGWGEWKTL